MEKRFNQMEFYRAYDLIKSNPEEACKRFKKYTSNYPCDYSAYPHYIMSLIKIRRLDDAIEIYNYVEKALNENPNIIENSRVFDVVSFKLLKCKVKILAYQGKYDELFSLYNNNITPLNKYNGGYISFYCRVKLHLLPDNYTTPGQYLFSQMFDYSEKRFLENIKKNLYSESHDNPNQFNPTFPFHELYSTIKKSLLEENKLYLGLFEDFYIFQYDDCGKCNNKETNYFAVICFHDTNNIITIRPFENGRFLPHFDLNVKNDVNVKTKSLSQIDKFNRRYQRD